MSELPLLARADGHAGHRPSGPGMEGLNLQSPEEVAVAKVLAFLGYGAIRDGKGSCHLAPARSLDVGSATDLLDVGLVKDGLFQLKNLFPVLLQLLNFRCGLDKHHFWWHCHDFSARRWRCLVLWRHYNSSTASRIER